MRQRNPAVSLKEPLSSIENKGKKQSSKFVLGSLIHRNTEAPNVSVLVNETKPKQKFLSAARRDDYRRNLQFTDVLNRGA